MTDQEIQNEREKTLLLTVLFTFFISGTTAQPLGSFIPYLRESYGLSYEVSGLLLSCHSVGNLLAVVVTGFLPALLGRRRSVLFTSVWMIGGYLILLSGAPWPAVLMAGCLMTGFARGGNSNFSNTMVSTLSGSLATRGYNLIHGGYAVGAVLTPLLLLACQKRWPASGWRVMAGALCVFAGLQVVTYGRMALPPDQFKERGRMDTSFAREKRFWLGAVMLFFYMSAEYAVTGWLVTYFQESGILPLSVAQMMNSLLWLDMFVGRLAGVWLGGRVSRNKLLVLDGAGFCLFFLVMFTARTSAAAVLGIAGLGLFMAGIYPTAFSFGAECIRGNDLGSSTMILVGSVGGILTPTAVGMVAERLGIRAGMGIVAALTALLLVSIVVSVLAVREKPQADSL
ncbi:MFS transporter [Pseudoflavonifractor phocaeensis]|uniref:MFS transporter n=1 Tax=Pseudoflavonifractor phocaeensis TaxID=1870988 RepID=UPI00313C27D4